MSPHFWRTFRIVAAVHAAVVLALLIAGSIGMCSRKHEFVQPIEFLVEAPPSLAQQRDQAPDPAPPAAEPEPAPDVSPAPEPAPEPLPAPKPNPAPKPKPRPQIVPDRTPIVRQPKGKPAVAPLPEAEIRKLLAMGAKPSDRTVIPEENDICFGLVRQAFYDAWLQPSREEVGDASAEITIRLGADGVVSQELRRPSGKAALDESVLMAARQVRRIQNLTPAFIAAHPAVTVLFKLE